MHNPQLRELVATHAATRLPREPTLGDAYQSAWSELAAYDAQVIGLAMSALYSDQLTDQQPDPALGRQLAALLEDCGPEQRAPVQQLIEYKALLDELLQATRGHGQEDGGRLLLG